VVVDGVCAEATVASNAVPARAAVIDFKSIIVSLSKPVGRKQSAALAVPLCGSAILRRTFGTRRFDGAPMLARSTLEGLLQNPRQYGGIP
jgi:hypothetical protein